MAFTTADIITEGQRSIENKFRADARLATDRPNGYANRATKIRAYLIWCGQEAREPINLESLHTLLKMYDAI